jgi:hypothetical protein
MNLLEAIKLTWRELLTTPAELQRKRQEALLNAIRMQSDPIPDATGDEVSSDYEYIPILPTVSHAALLKYVEDNQTNVYKYFYNVLKQAISQNLKDAVLFRLGSSKMLLRIEREQFVETLEEMTKHFVAVEEYEMVPKCKKLIDKHYVNELTTNG